MGNGEWGMGGDGLRAMRTGPCGSGFSRELFRPTGLCFSAKPEELAAEAAPTSSIFLPIIMSLHGTAMRQPIHTDKAPAAIGPYSQAVRCGDTVYMSGQIPIDPAT